MAIDSAFWRKFAHWGATSLPTAFVRFAPPVVGLIVAALVPRARRAVVQSLRLARGNASLFRDVVEVAQTFSTYASCLTETLATGSKNGGEPSAQVFGHAHVAQALAGGAGAIFVTAHTAGWEIVGPLLRRDHDADVGEFIMVMEPEVDAVAREIQDRARRAAGLRVVHASGNPFVSLDLVRALREKAIVAIQVDRVPKGKRTRNVRLFDNDAQIPEGPLRLAQASGAPIVPIFCARDGHRTYRVEVHPPIRVGRRTTELELDLAAQRIADAMGAFLRAHATQWFHFGG